VKKLLANGLNQSVLVYSEHIFKEYSIFSVTLFNCVSPYLFVYNDIGLLLQQWYKFAF